MTSIATFPTTIAQFLQNLPSLSAASITNPFNRKQETAIDRAFAEFSKHYRNEVDALFDEHFLSHAGEPILSKFAAGNIDRHDAATALAQVWSDHLGPVSGETRRRRIRDVTMAADALLNRFEIELGRPQLIDRAEMSVETSAETNGEAAEETSSPSLVIKAIEMTPGSVKLSATGKLDADSYMDMVNKAEDLYQRGARNLELDLADLTDVHMSGLYALHCAAKIFRGEVYPSREYGIAGLRQMVEENLDAGLNDRLRLLSVNSAIVERLQQAGIYAVYSS